MKSSRMAPRGTTLIETMIAMVVLIVGSLGVVTLQLTASKTNALGARTVQGAALASDLAENIRRWEYTDTRLNSTTTVTSPDVGNWDLGVNATPAPMPTYSDANLGTFQGLSNDIDRNGTADIFRYWNVYIVNDGTSEVGKLIQVIVRWRQSNLGWKQTTTTVFKRKP